MWTIPRPWQGALVVVVGAGPSLRGFDRERLRGLRCVAVNRSYEFLPDPAGNFAYFHDRRFGEWHGAGLAGFRRAGGTVVTSSSPVPSVGKVAHRVHRDPREVVSFKPDTVAGKDSGGHAVNLAAQLGAATIVLVGFDMRFDGERAHWHDEHPVPARLSNYERRFLPDYEARVKTLAGRGVRVVTATPSALAVPLVELEEETGRDRDEAAREGPRTGEGATALPV